MSWMHLDPTPITGVRLLECPYFDTASMVQQGVVVGDPPDQRFAPAEGSISSA